MFKKSSVIGVSISPEKGLEVAQVDYSSGLVHKYKRKSIEYNSVKREIADLDIFKETLQELLEELNIPKNSEIVLNMPAVTFKVGDYPSALEEVQVESAIEEELYDNPYLKNYEPCYGYSLINSSLQFNKYAYTALQKSTMIEIIMSIQEMGYKVTAIDNSVSSMLRSLIYLDRVNTDPDTNWVLLTVDNSCCRIISMMGKKYLDVFEEKISIGEVLSDAENYTTVISAIEPILKSLPSKYLCVVSKTNIISAEVLSNKIQYSAPIIYQEANGYLKEPLLNLSPLVEEEYNRSISLDVIGAAIYHEYSNYTGININLFNKSLGEIYLMFQPPTLFDGKIVLSNPFLLFIASLIGAILVVVLVLTLGIFAMKNNQLRDDISLMERDISKIDRYIELHKEVSEKPFDEGFEIRKGLTHNKNIYSYYTIVGTEIPKKLWLTHLKFGDKITIDGQADNIESVYAFFRSIKDYDPQSDISLQDLALATARERNIDGLDLADDDTEFLLTTLDADFYDFRISNDISKKEEVAKEKEAQDSNTKAKKTKSKSKKSKAPKTKLP